MRRRATRPRFLAITIGFAALLSQLVAAALEPVQASEDAVKAAFIGKFLQFVEWLPPRALSGRESFVIAVVGSDPFAMALPSFLGQQVVEGRRVRVLAGPDTAIVVNTHLVFIGASERARLPSIVRELENARVVTVGDTPGFGEAGVMLNLYVSNDRRVRFEANTSAAARAGIRLHSQLLRLARIVG